MKKLNRIFSILLTLLMLLSLCACGASLKQSAAEESAPSSYKTESMVEYDMVMEETTTETVEAEMQQTASTSTAVQDSAMSVDPNPVEDFAEKIIYFGYVTLETTTFDDALSSLEQAVNQCGGFIQDSQVSGNARYNDDGTTTIMDRYGFYVVRVPSDQFEKFMSATGGVGNVVSSSRSAQNVTSQYTDYEARLTSLYTQEERLLAMLEKSGDLESLITLESRLSEVRYEIESIERNLRNLNQKLAYSTVELNIHEVEVFTPTVTVNRSFGEKLSDAFADGWSSFTRGIQRFVLNVAESLPSLVLTLVLIVIALLAVRILLRRVKAKRQRKQEPPVQENEQK